MSSKPLNHLVQEWTAPGLLIAGPQMGDPNFEGSLILMAQHGEQGALGFVINRPAPLDFETLLQNVDQDLVQAVRGASLSSHEVLMGGPVQQTAVWLLFERELRGAEDAVPEADEDLLLVGDRYALGATRDLLDAFLRGQREGPFLVLLGYAGWGPGQLEEEIAEGVWLPVALEHSLIFDLPHAEKRDAALRCLGLEPGTFLISGHGAKA